MANVYFNLNQIQSNPDGQPTVKRQSRLTSNPGEMNKKEQLSRDCLRDASESPLRCLRYLSRIAMIFCVLAMSVGQMWGAEDTLINQSTGAINNTDFWVNVSSSSTAYTVEETPFSKCISLGGGFTSPVGAYPDNKIIRYDVKTNDVTITVYAYNKATSKYSVYVSMLEEGATTAVVRETSWTGKSGKVITERFTPTKNASIYVHVGNNTNLVICQVSASENGSNLPSVASNGYSIRLDSCRATTTAGSTEYLIDGALKIKNANNGARIWNKSYPIKLKSTSDYISFITTSTMIVSIKASGTYSVTKSNTYQSGSAISGNQEVELTSGTWYICPNGSNTSFTTLSFASAAPSCTNPTASWSTAPANGTAGGNMNASLTTNYAAGVEYTSSNTDVATVSGNGTTTCAINYVAAGTARITATVTGDGSTICAGPATCYTDITVSAPEPSCGETAQAALTLSSNSGTICGTGTATFTVSGGSGSGALSVSSSDETKATASIDGSTVTVTGVAAGSATITVTKACDATYAEKTATYSATVAAIPTANAGADKTTEPGNGVALAATAAASGCTGAWTIQSGPNTSTAQLSSTSLATATFTPTVAGTYTLRWTVTNTSSSCSAYDEMTITAAVCSISDCGNATLTYPIYTSGDLTTSNLFSGASSTNATAVSVGSSPAFTGVTVSAAKKGSAANAGACYAKGTALTGKMQYSASSKSSSYYIDFPFTVNTGYTFTPCDVQVVIQPVSSNQTFTVEITNGTNVYGTTTATLNAGVMEPIIGLTSTAEMSAGNYAVRLYPHGGSSKEFRMGANVILKGTTASAAPSCTAPTSPSITPSNGWLYVPGEEITLTASASNTDASTTYTWYRGATLEAAKAAGAIQAAKTSAQGGTTYTIASCTASDAYKYWCEISNGTGCEASASYDIKLYTFFLYNNDNSNNSSHAFTSIDRTYKKLSVTFDVSNATYTYYFKVSDGLGTWYGKNSSTITSATNWCDGLNSSGANVGLTTTLASSYTVDYYYESNNVVVTYPVPNQTAGQTVYFDNTLTQMSNMYIRIGSTSYSSASSAFTAVPGTAALYQGSTIAWDGFAAWSIADNTGWTDNNSIYQPWNGQWTGTGNNYQMSKQTDYQNYAVSGAVTIVPTALHNSEYNCQYYNVDKYNGMLRDRVTITAPTNGTITVNYTSEEGVASSFSATTVDMNQDLAHTVIITPTATPAEGYTLSGLTVNGAAHTSGNTYTVTANTTIAATFSPASYTVTLNTNGGTINAGNVTSYTYGTGATLPTNVTKSGFTFGGWYDNSGLTGSAVTTISTTATGNKEYWAKWTAAASLTALECNTRYTVQDMTAGGCGTLSGTSCYSAGLSANNRFEVLGDPSKTDQAGGTPEQKTNSNQTINSIDFTSFMYLKGDGLNGSTEPTCRGVKFIIPSAGKLTIYYRYGDRSKLKKEGEDAVNVGATTGGYGYDTHDVTAGTYYIYGVSSGAVLIAVEYQCCTTPAAPTAFAAGSITSTGATFSITDAANAASYDIYYTTSSTAPTAGTAATTTSTEKTKTVTGLTASTTYYAWVRSVCDADHKSAWVALAGSSFETSAAAATPILSWALSTNVSTWTATPTNNDETNLTDVATSTEHAAIQSGATSGKTCKISLSSSATPDKYVTFTFKVACGKKLTPSSVWMEVANVGGSSGGKMTHKAELSDTYGHTISATVVPASDGVLNELNITNGGGTYFQGEVTLKVWAWNSSGTNGTAFRMGPNVKIFGEVGSQATPAATITWNTQPANGQVGDPDFAYDVTCSDGSTVTVTSANTTYATIVGGKLHYAAAGTTHLVATATDACGNVVVQNSSNFTVSAAAPTYSVTHSLTNVTATSGATGAGAATEGVAYNAVFAANTGYVLPSTIHRLL